MKFNAGQYWVTFFLCLILVVSLGLHLVWLYFPAHTVFDEAHFSTYAIDYLVGRVFVDIHPSLGKLLYAGVLALSGKDLQDQETFLNVKLEENGRGFLATTKNAYYLDFPYFPLRIFSSVFGVLLPLVVFGFMRSIGIGATGSLITAALIVVENALLLETRLILLNGMYLVFGFSSLGLYFYKRSQWLAGVLWGLALSVKLVGIVFLGPILVGYLFNRHKNSEYPWGQLKKFLVTGLVVLLFFIIIDNIFFTPQERFETWHSLQLIPGKNIAPVFSSLQKPFEYILATGIQLIIVFVGYTVDQTSQPHLAADLGNTWYLWPLMYTPILYYEQIIDSSASVVRRLTLTGNQVVWYAGTGSVLVTIFYLIFIARKRMLASYRQKNQMLRQPVILLSGYIASLLPFALVNRITFLYHYFPALLFSLALLGYLFEQLLIKTPGWRRWHKAVLVISILVMAWIGFMHAAPETFGFLQYSTSYK